jgi:Cof subfamily protein (haloacid dehalogenase superfamily)
MSLIKLVASDLDGTLLHSDLSISARTAIAMQRADSAGITIVWATARARQSVMVLAERCGFRGIALCANGAVVLDMADGARVVGNQPVAASVLAAAQGRISGAIPGIRIALVGASRFVAERGYAAISRFDDHHRAVDDMELVETLLDIEDEFVKIIARHPEIPAATVFRSLMSVELPGLELTHSLAPFVEMSAAGISKAFALAALAGELGIDPTNIAAIGDALNDLAMLEWAGVAIAPANAIPEIKAISSQIVPSNNDDGVAIYLESLLNLG